MTNDDRVRLGNRLRAAREQAGFSQGQAAKELGLHRPSISEMEAGRRRVSVDELAALSRLYDIDIAWLTGQLTDQSSEADDRMLLAARDLSNLKEEDIDKVLNLLRTMRKDRSGD